jgi:hypothetical protein
MNSIEVLIVGGGIAGARGFDALLVATRARPVAGAEAQYLFDLRRRYRISDPALASLGREMRAMQSR